MTAERPGPDEQMEDQVIVLTDEDGEEHEFVVLDMLEVGDREYMVLMDPDSDEDEEEQAVILRVEKGDDGEEILVDIEDEDEFERVAEAWESALEEDEEDEDEEAADDDEGAPNRSGR